MAKGRSYVNVLLVSTAGTGYEYITQVPSKGEKASVKINKRKFDPRYVNPETGKKGGHVMFEQKKLVYKAN